MQAYRVSLFREVGHRPVRANGTGSRQHQQTGYIHNAPASARNFGLPTLPGWIGKSSVSGRHEVLPAISRPHWKVYRHQ